MKTNIKVIATSLSLATSVGAVAGMSGLSVQSHLGQPFSGSIVVSGDEARALIANGSINVSGGMRASMIKQGEDRVVVRLRSSSPVHDPVLTFRVSAGHQTREYTAFLNPARYIPQTVSEPEFADVRDGELRPTRSKKQPRQQPQRDFIERKKTVVEQRREASSVPMQTEDYEMAAVKKNAKVSVSPRRHRAHAGERLANIVERYRPRNMSQQTAMRALMLANPSAFKHGTTIRRNITLYIPTESQWHAYAQRAQKQVMKERVRQVRQGGGRSLAADMSGNNEPAVPMPNDTVVQEPAPVKPTTKNKPVENKPTENKPVENKPVENKPVENQAIENKPVQKQPDNKEVQAVTPSAPVIPAVEKAVDNASGVKADAGSNAVEAPKPNDVSASATSVPEQAAEQPKPQPRPAPQPVVEEPVEEETDYLTLGLMGLGAAVVVGGGAFALSRRRKKDDGEWEAEEIAPARAAKGKNGKAKKAIIVAEEEEKDLWNDDSTFDLQSFSDSGAASVSSGAFKEPAPTVIDDEPYFAEEFSDNAPKDTFNLDDFEADGFDSGANNAFSGSQNTQNQQDDDWSLDNDTTSSPVSTAAPQDDFIVAEDDDWSLDNLSAVSNTPSKNPEQSFSLDDFVVDDVSDVVMPMTSEPKFDDTAAFVDEFDVTDVEVNETVSSAKTVASAPQSDDVFSLDSFDDFVLPESNKTEPIVENTVVVDEPVSAPSFNDDVFDDFTAFSEPETPAAPVVNNVVESAPVVDDDLAFGGLDSFDDFIVAEPETVASSPVIDVPETPVEVSDSFADFESFADLDTFTETEKANNVVETPASLPEGDDLAFGLDAFDDFVTPEVNDDVAVQTTDNAVSSLVDDDLFDVGALDSVETIETKDEIISTFDLPIADDVLAAPETVVATTDVADDFDLGMKLDDFVVSDEIVETKETLVENVGTSAIDDLAFGLNAFDDVTLPESDISEVSASSNNQELVDLSAFDDLSVTSAETSPLDDFVVHETAATVEEVAPTISLDDFVVSTPSVEEPAISLDAPLVEEPATSFDAPLVEEPAISMTAPDVSSALDDLSFDDLTLSEPESAAPSLVTTEPVGMMDLTTGPLTGSSLDSLDLDSLEVADDLNAWDTGSADNNAGFVSGAVSDMTEPLEAKFELAKMYLEIDDAVAARETLLELISESSGDIQNQAKSLLAELGH